MHGTIEAPPLLPDLAALDSALKRSFTRPVVIFKHSSTCGVSALALEEIAELRGDPSLETDVFMVLVHPHRPVSHAIARILRVRHESPQALILHRGAALWHASHFRISAQAVREALGSVSPARPKAVDRWPDEPAVGAAPETAKVLGS
ncbi:MAG: bacillithiol system redox-active protein YtxJ [Acidobacteria bacterium]|nr:bacillithiol system redox-active protein YtxJ [Acidobacteriota bacterium]